ncbi:MAG: 16S rRNA (guanine(527)-N(7))-methyltransferase RsmG [Hyphomicrobiales bacterium]
MQRLALYESLLNRWQKSINLVAPDSLPGTWHRHFADSAQLAALAPDARTWLDLGSGAGFPGMVVAILLANRGARVHLCESNAKKCAFLAEVARKTGAPVEIHQTRIERLVRESTVAATEVVTARALAPLGELLEMASPLLENGACGLFLKGMRAVDEIAAARRGWTFRHRCHGSRTDPAGRIVEITGLKRDGSDDFGSADD